LKFRRWLGVESATWDHATVEVSNNGTQWTSVWAHTGDSLAETSWSLQTYDISAIADDQARVYVRWSMGPTDGSVTYSGWNLDDIEIWGFVPVSPPCDCDGDGDVDLNDFAEFDRCQSGPGGGVGVGCGPMDVDEDLDVDRDDFAVFQLVFTGPANP